MPLNQTASELVGRPVTSQDVIVGHSPHIRSGRQGGHKMEGFEGLVMTRPCPECRKRPVRAVPQEKPLYGSLRDREAAQRGRALKRSLPPLLGEVDQTAIDRDRGEAVS